MATGFLLVRPIALFMLVFRCASAANEARQRDFSAKGKMRTVENVFLRSEKVHLEAIAAIMSTMSTGKAWQVLQSDNRTNVAAMQVSNLLYGMNKNHHLRQPKGYSGIDGARKLLNDMIFESMSKYDAEIAKCTEYYAQQCAGMEACRGKIAGANYVAANSRALILDSQANINKCEVHIPVRKYELKQHLIQCEHELHKMNERLKIILGDIAVMTTILEMTDCEKSSFIQMDQLAPLHCNRNPACKGKSFVTFNDDRLRRKISKLQSSVSLKLMKQTFADLFEGIESFQSATSGNLLRMGAQQEPPKIKKTEFNNPPVPFTKVPRKIGPPDPWVSECGCTMGKSPQCYKLQERFLLIQSGIQDERDGLMEAIATLERSCEETKKTLETQIADDEKLLEDSQTKLALATEKEANAGEVARNTEAEHSQLNSDLMKQMKTCSSNYISFETELCALKKIRGELYKMKGGGHSAFFQDCEVSKWDPEECSKQCKGGEQKLTRNILTHPSGGARCLPLEAMRRCNLQPCPVDCHLKIWSGWSKCSAECGGGVQQRLREVKMAMKYGGKPCGATSETKACNNQACEKDCKLSSWTKWTACSKDCDGGTQRRQKFVKEEPQGAGECPGQWSEKRLQYKQCNMIRCKTPPNVPLNCSKKLDVVIVLDGSSSLGKQGWKAEIKAATTFVDAFAVAGSEAQISLILYSGPKTWSGVNVCTGKSEKKVDTEKVCKIRVVQHFTNDFKKLKTTIAGLDWPHGSTLTSLALLAAKAELSLGRKDAKANVVVITDGRPMSYRKTSLAARSVRQAARLLWVPVTNFAPLKFIKSVATRRWQENVVHVKNFEELEHPEVVTHIVANICPKEAPKLKFARF
jgi:hypothetical protein